MERQSATVAVEGLKNDSNTKSAPITKHSGKNSGKNGGGRSERRPQWRWQRTEAMMVKMAAAVMAVAAPVVWSRRCGARKAGRIRDRNHSQPREDYNNRVITEAMR